jgi:hypothetical protein
MSTPFADAAVKAVFDDYPPAARRKLLRLRELIFKVAAQTEGVDFVINPLTETLKWGEPAYLTVPLKGKKKSGSTVRIAWKTSAPDQVAMLFNCNTTLVDTFRTLFPNDFSFDGNRALVFHTEAALPTDALALCIRAALTYHARK